MKKRAMQDIFYLFIVTRILLFLTTYIAYVLLTAPKYSNTPVDVIALFTTWNQWDAANYIRIAQHGYLFYDVTFFPLFPFLIACISHILGDWSYILVGTVISNAALLGTLFILYHLITDSQTSEVAQRTLLYLCIFPTAFFFFAPYNESLYLFFATGTFLALQRQRWWIAGSLGLLAALTRNIGILLVIPFLYELWVHRGQMLTIKIHRAMLTAISIMLIPLGTLIYAIYCWWLLGNPLAFLTAQQHSGRHLAWPWYGIWQSLVALFSSQPFGSSNQAHILLNVSATLGFSVLIIIGWSKLPRSYSFWMLFCLIYILLYPALEKPDVLLSNQRFVLEMFPAFITLAMLGKAHPRFHQTLVVIFPTLLAVLSIAFLMNRWMV